MTANWISLQNLPPEGETLTFTDQDLWETLFKEMEIGCSTVEPLSANVLILPQEKGILFRGKITGVVALACDRCSEESISAIRHAFDSFEPYPSDPYDGGAEDSDDPVMQDIDEMVIRRSPQGSVEINPFSLVWQEFLLSLPVKPLCKEDCAGLCQTCGINRNTETCGCVKEQGDPRMAALRGLTINKK